MTADMMKLSMAAVVVALALGACGTDDSEFAALYDPPGGPSTASLTGRWGGAKDGSDTRWVLAASSIQLANKCGSKIVGVSVAAEVSESAIRILESKQAGDDSCFVNATPGTLTVCPTDPFMPKTNCFIHDNMTLTLFANDVDFLALTKIDD
jgi:hypothetical protein